MTRKLTTKDSMNSVCSIATVGIAITFSVLRKHAPTNQSIAKNKPLTHWTYIDFADFSIRVTKQPLKIAGKIVKQLKRRNSLEKRSLRIYLTCSNALITYTLLTGTVFMTYQKLRKEKSEIGFTARSIQVTNHLLNSSKRICKCYSLINLCHKLFKNPSQYAIPALFASVMVSLNVYFSKS